MENGQIARGVYEELYSRGKLEFIDRHYDPDFRGHETLSTDNTIDRLKANVRWYRSTFPDVVVKVEELVEAGDKVVVRWTAHGTNRGELFGQPPTGKQMHAEGISILTFRNGKIIEERTQWDVFGMVHDLGLGPVRQVGAGPAT